MPAAKVDITVEYGESWNFQALFPNTLSLVGATVDVEITKLRDEHPCRAYIKLSNADGSLMITGQQVHFLLPHTTLQKILNAGKYHWRLYVQYSSTDRDEVMGGVFNYKEVV